MRPVNLLPLELRPRIPGEGDPRIAWGIIGGLAVVLLMVVVSIAYSNKAKTLNDEANSIRAEAERIQASVVVIPTTPDNVSEMVHNQQLLVGGLAAVRFPWNTAMRDLSKSLPRDTTLDSITGTSATANAAAANAAEPSGTVMSPQMTLTGCVSGWTGYARLLTWLRQMPGVSDVKSTSSSVSPVKVEAEGGEAEQEDLRLRNCGPAPLNFALNVTYHPKSADLTGLPRPAAPAAGATPETGAAPEGVPAADTGGG